MTVDVEGFAEGMAESFCVPREMFDDNQTKNEIERNTESVLDLFDELKIRATFFVLGRIAEDIPAVVRRISDRGQEVGSHSFYHLRIFGQSPGEFRSDLVRSRRVLQDISGQSVNGFRAPDFSIRSKDLWEMNALKDAGFEYDASLTGTDIHDVYGNAGVSKYIYRLPNGLWELPSSTFRIFGRTVPFGGGGYLRLYPVALTRKLMESYERDREPGMIYLHPYEVGPVVPKIPGLSAYRRFRHYHNTGKLGGRLKQLAKYFHFDSAENILRRRISK